MSELLLFNIEQDKAIRIKNLCRQLCIPVREIMPEDFGRTLGYLLGESDDDRSAPDAGFADEMLYLVDIRGGMLDILLSGLRRKRASVALKAVKTDTNLTFTPYELWRELCAERAAIAEGFTAHE